MRKIRSIFKIYFRNFTTLLNVLKIKTLEENISLGKNLSIGKNITIKTTDGGRIIIGDNVTIEANTYIYSQKGIIHIEDNSFIGFGSQIVSLKSIKIGSDSLISAYCILRDANHGMKKNTLINLQTHDKKDINIGNDVWLGAHTVVTAGVDINTGAVCGANSVITKNIKSYEVVAGVPAKHLKFRE